MPYTVNSRALTGEKPCINKGFLVPLKHRKLTFNMVVPGPLKLLDPLKKKKKMLEPVLNPVFLAESPLLYSSR